jgi:hypothetical protein
MMEGVASEAASLAGHLGLDNLCWVYDNNHITIEGNTRIAFTEDIAARFLGYGWNVLRVGDANDIDRIEHALQVFRQTKDRPTFLILDSHIGYGSPHKQDTPEAHGEPLGDDEVRLAKRSYGWPEDAKFLVPDGVREHFAAGVGVRGAQARHQWTELFTAYAAKYPALASEVELIQRRELPTGWDRDLPVFPADPKGVAGREASGKVLNVLAQNLPWFRGGSADLGSSNKTTLTYPGAGSFQADSPGGKNLHYRVGQRGQSRYPGPRPAACRRDPRSGGLDPILGHPRATDAAVSGQCAATKCQSSHRDRTRLHPRLGSLYWSGWPRYRHAYLWRVRTAQVSSFVFYSGTKNKGVTLLPALEPDAFLLPMRCRAILIRLELDAALPWMRCLRRRTWPRPHLILVSRSSWLGRYRSSTIS